MRRPRAGRLPSPASLVPDVAAGGGPVFQAVSARGSQGAEDGVVLLQPRRLLSLGLRFAALSADKTWDAQEAANVPAAHRGARHRRACRDCGADASPPVARSPRRPRSRRSTRRPAPPLVVPDVRNQAFVFAKGDTRGRRLRLARRRLRARLRGEHRRLPVSRSRHATLIDTGAPLVTLTLKRNGSYTEAGERPTRRRTRAPSCSPPTSPATRSARPIRPRRTECPP